MMKMKQPLLIALSLCFCCIAAALEVSLEPVRRNINAGNFIQLKLSSDKAVTRIDYPAVTGAAWENAYSSSGMQNINGKVTYTRVLMLSPEKEGVITIPPFKVTCGSESAMTKAVEVRVLPRDKAPEQAVKVEDVVKGTVTLAPAAGHFWAGEEITLYCDLFVESKYSSQIRITYFPELLNTGNAIFTTYNFSTYYTNYRISTNNLYSYSSSTYFCFSFICSIIRYINTTIICNLYSFWCSCSRRPISRSSKSFYYFILI